MSNNDNSKVYVDSKKIKSIIPDINTALSNIDVNRLQIDFATEDTNLHSVISYVEENNNVFIPMIDTFEVNLAKVLQSIGRSIEAYAEMESGISAVISAVVADDDKSSLFDE